MDRRLITWALLLCPSSFRIRYENEILQVYATQKRLDHDRSSNGSRYGLLFKTVGGVVLTAMAIRLEPLWRDLLYAGRQMKRKPFFSAAVVLTLAIGIGVSTALFGLFSTVLLKPLPLHEPSQLMMVWNDYSGMRTVVSAADYHFRRSNAESFSDMAAAGVEQSFALSGDREPISVSGSEVSSNFFDVVGVQPMLGRGFVAGEDETGKGQVVILGQGLWERWFGGDQGALGQTIVVDGQARRIVGIMPQAFDFPHGNTEIWRPLELSADLEDYSQHGNEFIATVARLNAGFDVTDARIELDRLDERFKQLVPDRQAYLNNAGWGSTVQPVDQYLRGDIREVLSTLLGAALLVLLLVCANVTSLQMARVSNRRNELAVRGALGASTARVVRQLLTEIGLMVTLGGLIGLMLIWLLEVTTIKMVAGLIQSGDLFATPVLLFGLGVIAVTGLVCGVLPVSTFRRSEVLSVKSAISSRKTHALRRTAVIVQTALAVMLVFAATAAVGHLGKLLKVEPGFEVEGRYVFKVKLPGSVYAGSEQRAAFASQLEAALLGSSSVMAVGANGSLPLLDHNWTASFNVEHFVPGPDQPPPNFEYRPVTAGYRATMGINLLSGRDFAATDHADALPVAMVDASLAETYFSDVDPLGQRIGIDTDDDGIVEWREIVGVVAQVRNSGLDIDGAGQVYFPYAQAASRSPWFVVHANLSATQIKEVVTSALYRLNPTLPFDKFTSLQDGLAQTLTNARVSSAVLGSFAVLAFVLAVMGVYSLVNYSVVTRKSEFGLKMALGAKGAGIAKGVIADGLRLSLVGVLIGACGAAALSKLIESQLVTLPAQGQLSVLLSVCVLLCLAAGFASAIPAFRAAQTHPARALQET